MTKLATETYDWVDGLCRQFSEATSWPMQFLPADQPAAKRPDAKNSRSDEYCWSKEISDGGTPIGKVVLNLPSDKRDDRSFLAISSLSELFADMTGRLAAASRQLASRNDQVTTLVNIGRSVPREQDLPSAMKQLLLAATQLTQFRAAGFFLLNPKTNSLKLRVSHEVDLQQVPFLVRELADNPPDLIALTRGRVLLRRDPANDEGMWLPGDAATGVCVPVESDAGPIGTLWAYDRRLKTPDERQIHVLQSIASQMAVLLERVVLLRESATQQRLKRDLEIASVCQQHEVLGETLDNVDFDAAAICTSRYELGGDLCEIIPLDANRTVIAIGDASGDSVPAALVMSAVRGALRTVSSFGIDDVLRTELIVRRLNKTLHAITPPDQFMSLLYGVLDTSELTFTYTNAGHPTPLHVSGAKITTLESHGMLLGVAGDASYSRSIVSLSPGDTLVLFSDGISEAMNARRKLFRSEGIAGAIKGRCSGSAHDVLQTILLQLEQHTADSGESDDRTLLVIKMPQ
ncbi:MAG: GAF domain-containing SpoIIE family protein phosphatase [Planctomycetaceae bacterium]